MRVLTGNVFVTKSLPAISKVHDWQSSKVKSFNENIKELTDDEYNMSFIASPMKNEGLLHFEYSFTANSKQNGGSIVTLRLLETSKFLEMFLLENNPLERIIEAKEKAIDRIGLGWSSPDGKETATRLDNMYFQNKLKRSSRFYFSFGVGDDISQWSGPYAMQLAGATLKNDENNVRIIEVTFISNTETMKTWSPTFGAMFTSSEQFKNLGEFITPDASYKIGTKLEFLLDSGLRAREADRASTELQQQLFIEPRFASEIPGTGLTTDLNTKKIEEIYSKFTYSFNLTLLITKLYRNYIDSMTKTQGNSIVVIPQDFGKMYVSNTGPNNSNSFIPSPKEPYRISFSVLNPDADFEKENKKQLTLEDLTSLGIDINLTSSKESILGEISTKGFDFLRQVGQGFTKDAKTLGRKSIRKATEDAKAELGGFQTGPGGIGSALWDSTEAQLQEYSLFYDKMVAKRESKIQSAEESEQNANASSLQNVDDFKALVNANDLVNILNPLGRSRLGWENYWRGIGYHTGPLVQQAINLGYDGTIPLTDFEAFETYALSPNVSFRSLLLLAGDIEIERNAKIEEQKKENAIKQANTEFEEDIKPGSLARRKYAEERGVALEKIAREATANEPDAGELANDGSLLANRVNDVREKVKSINSMLNFAGQKISGFFDLVEDHGLHGISLTELWKFRYLKMSVEANNEASKEGYEGFTPLVAPLIRFGSKVTSINAFENDYSEYDFYEETNVEILKLWARYGLIEDSSRPAYVFGDMKTIKNLLYLEGVRSGDSISKMNLFSQFSRTSRAIDGSGRISFRGYTSNFKLDPVKGINIEDEAKREKIDKEVSDSAYKSYANSFIEKFPIDKQALYFRHNIERPNVISLDYRLDNYIAALNNMPVSPVYDKAYLGTTRIGAAKELAKKAIGDKILDKLRFIKSDTVAGLLSETIAPDGNLANPHPAGNLALGIAEDPAIIRETGRDFLDLFAMLLLVKEFDTISDKLSPGEQTITLPGTSRFDQYYSAMLNQTMKLLYKCRIKTLPMFHKHSYLKQPCILLGNTGKLAGTDQALQATPRKGQVGPQQQHTPAPYQGDYTIMGYRHVISTSDIYSEFDLYRKGHENRDVLGTPSIAEVLCRMLRSYKKYLEQKVQDKKDKTNALVGNYIDTAEYFNNTGITQDSSLINNLGAFWTQLTQNPAALFDAYSNLGSAVMQAQNLIAIDAYNFINGTQKLAERVGKAMDKLGCPKDETENKGE